MTLSGGKHKVNKSLKSWVAFVKKVQREEKLSYKDAIHRAKVRKDKGEKWMKGGDKLSDEFAANAEVDQLDADMDNLDAYKAMDVANKDKKEADKMQYDADVNSLAADISGGRRRRRTMRRSSRRGRGRGRTVRRARGRASRRY